MIESTLSQLLDWFANINNPAYLIQYHYYLLLISCCQKLTLQLPHTINYILLLILSCLKSSHPSKTFPHSLFPPLYIVYRSSSLFSDFPQLQFSREAIPPTNIANIPPQPLTLHIHAPILIITLMNPGSSTCTGLSYLSSSSSPPPPPPPHTHLL